MHQAPLQVSVSFVLLLLLRLLHHMTECIRDTGQPYHVNRPMTSALSRPVHGEGCTCCTHTVHVMQ